jgi:hypothetical protein
MFVGKDGNRSHIVVQDFRQGLDLDVHYVKHHYADEHKRAIDRAINSLAVKNPPWIFHGGSKR